MFKYLMIVMKKELKRVFTDKRLVITNFLLPMLSIALVYSVMGYMIKRSSEDIEAHITQVLGVNVPPAIVALIQDDPTIELTQAEVMQDEAEALLLKGDYDYYMMFHPDFMLRLEGFEAGLLPQIRALYSPKRDISIEANYKMRALLDQFKQNELAKRLGDASYLDVYALKADEITIPKEEKGIDRSFANLIPMLVSIFIFAGAMGVGMDSIAGEKERGTIATMLMTPVDRGVIIGGKVLSLSVVALVSMLSSFVGVVLSIPFSARFLSTSGELDMSQFMLGFDELGLFFLAMIGLVGIYVTLISVLSMMANSLKEAGAYITPAYMVVMITAFMNMFGSSEVADFYYYVPIYNNLVNMKQILSGDGNLVSVLISFGTSLAVTLVLVMVARNMMHKEKVVFPS